MTPEQKLNVLSDYLLDIGDYFDKLAKEFRTAASLIESVEDMSEGAEKQRRVRESRREDAIDELLRREGFSW